MKKWHGILVVILTMALLAGLLVWSFSDKDNAAEIMDAFRTARWQYLPLAMLVGLLVFPIKAYRWGVILRTQSQPAYRTMLSAIMIGFMVNCIYSRIGEVVRALVLGAKRETHAATAFASIVLERIFDLVVVGLFLIVALLLLKPPGSEEGVERLMLLRKSGMLLSVAFVMGVMFLILLRLAPGAMKSVIVRTTGWLPHRIGSRVQGFLESFLQSLNAIKSMRQVIVILALSIVHWSVQVLFFCAVGWCFPDLAMSWPAAMLVFVVSALGVGAAPVPLYLAVYQGAIVAAGAIMGMSKSVMTSYAWLCWAGNIPPIILVGFVFLWMEGLSLGDLRARAAKSRSDTPIPGEER